MAFSAVLFFSALVMLWIAYRCRLRPAFEGRDRFVVMQLGGAWWAAAAAMENLVVLPAHKVLWAEMAWLGIVAAPSFWALFVWSYVAGEGKRLGTQLAWGAFALAAVTWLVALTNDRHGLIYLAAQPASAEAGAPIVYRHGAWFYAITLYLYAVMLSTVVVMLDAIYRGPALYRRHYAWLLLAIALPWVANVGYVTGTLTLFGFDPTPFTFSVMSAVFYWLIQRRQLFDLPPIARNALLDAIPDAVLVLDGEDTIVEVNHAGLHLPGLPPEPIGRSLADAPYLTRALAPLPRVWEGRSRDIRIPETDQWYAVKSVPLSRGDRLAGRLLLLRDVTDRKRIEDRLRRTADSLKTQLANNMALQTQLREQAHRDPLTGLYNRRFCDEQHPVLLAEADAKGERLAIVMLDLDHFKRLNDTLGHQMGDAVLAMLGALLRRRVRQGDFAFRIGGEEVLVLLPGLDAEQALERVEAWRAEYEAAARKTTGGCPGTTFSAGIAIYPDDAASWDALLRQADQALYRAKVTGRDRALCWQDLALPKVG